MTLRPEPFDARAAKFSWPSFAIALAALLAGNRSGLTFVLFNAGVALVLARLVAARTGRAVPGFLATLYLLICPMAGLVMNYLPILMGLLAIGTVCFWRSLREPRSTWDVVAAIVCLLLAIGIYCAEARLLIDTFGWRNLWFPLSPFFQPSWRLPVLAIVLYGLVEARKISRDRFSDGVSVLPLLAYFLGHPRLGGLGPYDFVVFLGLVPAALPIYFTRSPEWFGLFYRVVVPSWVAAMLLTVDVRGGLTAIAVGLVPAAMVGIYWMARNGHPARTMIYTAFALLSYWMNYWKNFWLL